MKTTAALLALTALASCYNTASGDDYPTATSTFLPGGGGSNGPTEVLTGHVCLVTDPRTFSTCASVTTGENATLAGLAISLDGHVALTDASGNFTLPVPVDTGSTGASFMATGPGIVPASATFTRTVSVVTLPVISTGLEAQILASLQLSAIEGQGAVLLSVTNAAGVPVSGVTATVTPAPATGPFFDGSTATGFQPASTGVFGVMFAPGVTVGPVNVTLQNPQSGNEALVAGIQVIDGGITFVDTKLP